MKIVKKYPNFALFEDEKTGVKMSFDYFELGVKRTKQMSEEELKQYKRLDRDIKVTL